jgi:hypothetical protein
VRGKTARRLRQAAYRLATDNGIQPLITVRPDGSRYYLGSVGIYRYAKKWWKGAPHSERATVFRVST